MIKKCLHNLAGIVNRTVVVAGGLGITLVFFIILPLMQRLGVPEPTWSVRTIQTEPTQPPPSNTVVKPRSEKASGAATGLRGSPPPKFRIPEPMLDPVPLELTLEAPGFGAYDPAGMRLDLDFVGSADAGGLEPGGLGTGGPLADGPELPNITELDQKPRVLRQDPPKVTSDDLRRRMPGRVRVIFVVDEQGRVREAGVQQSTDPIFEAPALEAVRGWRFEPGRIKGRPVACRVSIWIGFSR